MKRRTLLHTAVVGCWLSLSPWAWADAFDDFHTAIIRDDYIAMRKLLQRGMDPNTVDERGVPGIVKAMRQESWRVAQVLVDAPGVQLDLASPQGETALMQAAIKGNLDMVRQLLAKGVRVNQPGWTALHYAASADLPQSVEIAALLLEHHAYIDAESPNKSTPLMLAAQYGSEAMVNLLLNEGADVQLRNQLGLSALDFAQRSDRDFMVRLIDEASRATRRSKASW